MKRRDRQRIVYLARRIAMEDQCARLDRLPASAANEAVGRYELVERREDRAIFVEAYAKAMPVRATFIAGRRVAVVSILDHQPLGGPRRRRAR